MQAVATHTTSLDCCPSAKMHCSWQSIKSGDAMGVKGKTNKRSYQHETYAVIKNYSMQLGSYVYLSFRWEITNFPTHKLTSGQI